MPAVISFKHIVSYQNRNADTSLITGGMPFGLPELDTAFRTNVAINLSHLGTSLQFNPIHNRALQVMSPRRAKSLGPFRIFGWTAVKS
jgi:hypothetical protein